MTERYLSEIRSSQITALLDKVRRKNYRKHLLSLRLEKIRSFNGPTIRFEFPVTALVGPNGGGKSTVLGAAACAYKDPDGLIKPGTFFPKSSIGDNSMADWNIEYDIVDRDSNSSSDIKRTSKFRQLRWVRDNVLPRDLAYFGINRTVPAGEKSQYKKLMKPSYEHNNSIDLLGVETCRHVEKILGRSVDQYRSTDISDSEHFYIGGDGSVEYSEFHFGAGEASIIRIVSKIELLPDYSLVLIEEIENGLHPVATRRMVEYLIEAAQRKSIQVIFTTHSDYALSPPPSDAIWSSLNGRLEQGKLSVETLRAVSGRIDKKVAIFVEDIFAKYWLDAILREKLGDRFDEVEVYPVAGDGNAERIHRNHIENPAIVSKSLCFIDGDSQRREDGVAKIFRLPGSQPELKVFDDVYENRDSNIAILTVSCQRDPSQQDNVSRAIEEVKRTNRDPHLIFNQIGIKIGFVPEVIVRGAFLSVWIRENENTATSIAEKIADALREYEAHNTE
ncbi:ATP-binding protein [Microcoleus sp. FACHB-1515]|uniref:ATP-dependent nuclease n=1 Tax=Cyanophyceae TaxID=3028117 RepID=UPI0016831224|nr:AAA family ATPase [Microcoleus sp. FACHB-1515]MBD2093422.1 ATP-binding protein [Microcoleus sp. FACHB-1515]